LRYFGSFNLFAAGTRIKKRIPEYLVRLYSGNWRDTRGNRYSQWKTWTLDIVQRDLKVWTLPGMKPKNWRQTEPNGVNMWPNASIWRRHELEGRC